MIQCHRPLGRKQEGFVLVIALIFLITLTVLGLAAAGTTSIETLMARNFRDRDTAFAAAEMALRDTEIRISGYYSNPATPLDPYSFPNDGATTACSNGLCASTVTQPVTDFDFFDSSASYAGSTEMGSWTNSANKTPSIAGLSRQPRHLIERVCRSVPGESATGSTCQYIYRISVQASGQLSSSRITLQETYVP